MSWSLGTLAQRFELELRGPAALPIAGVCALSPGRAGHLAFLADRHYRDQLAGTQAAAVLLGRAEADVCPHPALVADDPALAFAGIAQLFDRHRCFSAGHHRNAVVDATARVASSTWIGPGVVIEAGASVGERVFVGPGCVLAAGAAVGDDSRLEAQIWLGRDCRLGRRVRVEPGAVIGARGFGLVRALQGWVEMPQLGAVSVGDDVEIGASTTIDRGALEDTVIEDGVKLDNQIQIGHNCHIGAHTAIAACTGVAGSTRIGRNCLIGGAVGIGGHLQIGDGVVVLARAMVTKSLPGPGVYGSGLPVMPARDWRRLVARVRRLAELEREVRRVAAALKLQKEASESATDPGDTGD
ncbi:MAG: UDP-3-O-(3-hydroxymyristoyl)glucosamine N-acyltransferase [Gammaproteobacteria bacterium]|nr:UDP-3-O-(3-hydroxymyristoyl)glucosamine N-acyltransferase [Gammaproteobacteria bacterium]